MAITKGNNQATNNHRFGRKFIRSGFFKGAL